jgi:endonuclease/exonuclease/phosphatase family metal-dependent hydrolase
VTVALLVVTTARLASEWISMPTAVAAGGTPLRVATWNLEYGAVGAEVMLDGLADTDADVDVLALEELRPEHVNAIEASATLTTRFPYRHLFPDGASGGIGLLSRSPLDYEDHGLDPVLLETTLSWNRQPIRIIAAHPFPARIGTITPLRIPTGLDPTIRDAGLASLNARAAAAIARGESVIVIGDFNVAPTEAGYSVLTDGLRDAHVEVGIGPGWTWRPSRFETLPIGLLRIDLVLTSPDLLPVSTTLDCSRRGDHCLLAATLQPGP